MTINGLTIGDSIIVMFKMTCAQHHEKGGPAPCHQARVRFFADLKLEYEMDQIQPHLRDIFLQLGRWETEACTIDT